MAAALKAAGRQLLSRQFSDRTREVVTGLADALAELDRREGRTSSHDCGTTPHPDERATGTGFRPDFTDRVTRQLATLRTPTETLQQAGAAVLREADPARAQILYSDLKHRVAQANKTEARKEQQLTEIAEQRAQLDRLTDPLPLHALLDQATDAVLRGLDAGDMVQQACTAITAQLDAAAAAADREYVRNAVAEALRELGYDVADVTVATPGTLVVRQSHSHGVRADIRDGQIGIAAVRLGATGSIDRSSDRDAEDEFCRRLPGLVSALDSRGITTELREAKLPGLYTPETVAVGAKDTAQSPTSVQASPKVRRRSNP
ncbi:hypothetical protein L2K20_29600 [Mycobacterium sp. MBM]|nr:hypothetical protein [Mycobacterium sp. MBM]